MNPITGPFLRNYCDITSYARVLTFWSFYFRKLPVMVKSTSCVCQTVSIIPFQWAHVKFYRVMHFWEPYALMHVRKLWCTQHVNLNGFTVSTQVSNHNSVNYILSDHFPCYVWPPLKMKAKIDHTPKPRRLFGSTCIWQKSRVIEIVDIVLL